MSNHKGGPISLTDVMTPISNDANFYEGQGFYHLTVRNEAGNDIMYFGPDASNFSGFLEGGESITFHNMNPKHIYLQGTVGQTAYWFGDGSY